MPSMSSAGSWGLFAVTRFVRDDYLASYEGDRLTRSAALVRAYPKDLAVLAPHLASIEVPVAIVVGRNDPYGLARDAALLRERLPHARLNVSRPVTASGRSERPSSSRSSRNKCVAAFDDSCCWRCRCHRPRPPA